VASSSDTVDEFERRVQNQVERLGSKSFRMVEAEVTAKRLDWFKQHAEQVAGRWDADRAPSPRDAFEMLFFDYMGLAEDEVPVLSESPTEIVWASANPCDTLEACARLGLDTRVVCRAVYERSTQALISQLDPQLRFLRSYQTIRPYADYCEERIVRLDFEALMALAVEEALRSKSEGNKREGYGAVVVLGNEIVGRGRDTVNVGPDPSLHAEVNAIRQAAQTVGDLNLSGAVLLSTYEPCPMCASLAVWANLSAIVYGASIEKTAPLGLPRILIGAREVVERSPVMVEVIGGVLEGECMAIYQD
jgi:tRNA(Arg) A34 adenosine deaminase TadA